MNTNLDDIDKASPETIEEGVALAIGELTLRNASESEIRQKANEYMTQHTCEVVFVTTNQGQFLVDATNIYPYGGQGDAIAALMELKGNSK